MYTFVCQQCDKSFADDKHSNRKFCCRECWRKSQIHGLVTAICAVCNKEFTQPKTHKNKTCGKACKGKAVSLSQSTKMKRICQICGKEYERKAGKAGKFCSRACSDKGRKQRRAVKAEKRCESCGKSFVVPANAKELSQQRFCSRECFHQHINSGPIDKTCPQCGKHFQVAKMQKTRKFCSQDCYHTWNSGENHPLYTGTRDKYYGPNWYAQGRKARKRDGYRCQCCRITETKLGRKLDVHHIEPFRSFRGDYKRANRLSNLISLCSSCHKLAEHGKIAMQLPLLN